MKFHVDSHLSLDVIPYSCFTLVVQVGQFTLENYSGHTYWSDLVRVSHLGVT